MRTCLAALALFVALAGRADAVQLYATSGGSLARFDSASPAAVTSSAITGMGMAAVVGIDMRPADGTIMAVATDSRLYRLSPTGAASPIGGGFSPPALNGTAFGTDVNPQSDRVRSVSDAEQNLRINPLTGALAAQDSALNPGGEIVALAHARNWPGSTSTTVYGIDAAGGNLVTLAPPNSGTVQVVGSLGVGTSLNQNIGFDIAPDGTAYASIIVGGVSRLYTVDLSTGAATTIGVIGTGAIAYRGLTAQTGDAISFAPAIASGPEGGSVVLNVRRVGPTLAPMTVSWTAAPGTAGPGDYGASSGTVSWAAGDSADKPIGIPLAADGALEGDETFSVTLAGAAGTATVVPPQTATATVLDVAPAPPLPPPAPFVPPANLAPRVSVATIKRQRLAAVLARGLEVRVTANEPCRLTADVVVSAATARRAKIRRRIARATKQLAAGARATIRPRPSAAVRRKLRRRRSLAVTVELSCVDAAGLKSTVSRTPLTLRRG